MWELDDKTFNIFVNNIQKQFLCCYPLNCISWQDFPKNLNWEQQKTLMDRTFNSPLNEQFPITLSYQLNFLKKLISFLENNCFEIHDVVYESYCRMQQELANDCTKKYAFKHYIVKPGIKITLRESKSFVAGGTTGLCSWPASLALSDFLIENPSVVTNKCVLELGAGTGLCGLVMMKICQPRHLILTDGSVICVELMCENLKRNFPQGLEDKNKFKIDTQMVKCLVVPWESIKDNAEISVLKPEIIIAADIVYDDSCFKDLSSAIDYVFKLKKDKVQLFLAATVRNEVTLNGFLDIMESLCFQISECDVVPLENSNLFWNRSTLVKILKFTR